MVKRYTFLQFCLAVWLSVSVSLAAQAQVACVAPSSVLVNNITATGALVSWAGPANATSYTVVYGPAGASPTTSTTITGPTSPIVLTGLIAHTTYTVCVQASCGLSGQSTQVCPLNFTTRAAVTTAYPYLENFDATTAPALPMNYATLDANNDGHGWANVASTQARSPANVMQYTQSPTQAADDWFFTTDMAMQAGKGYQLQFSYRAFASTFPEALEVKVGAAATPAGQTRTLFTNTNIANTSYATTTPGNGVSQVLNFSPPASGIYYFGFHATSAANAFYLFVDDITVMESVVTATKSSAESSFSAQASPVPFGQTLNLAVNLRKAGPLQLALHDALGRPVRRFATAALPVGSSTVALPEVASLPAGVYFLTIEQGGATQVIRVAHE